MHKLGCAHNAYYVKCAEDFLKKRLTVEASESTLYITVNANGGQSMQTLEMIRLANSVMPKVIQRLREDMLHYAGDLAMTHMVVQDAADPLHVLELLSDGDSTAARAKLYYMDTAPREDLYVLLVAAGGEELFQEEAA